MPARVRWERPTRPGWSAFHHSLIGTVQVGEAPDGSRPPKVATYTEPDRGRILAGHVVVDGTIDLRIKPGQTLVIEDVMDPSTWRVASS